MQVIYRDKEGINHLLRRVDEYIMLIESKTTKHIQRKYTRHEKYYRYKEEIFNNTLLIQVWQEVTPIVAY
jgi:hypothetical protein